MTDEASETFQWVVRGVRRDLAKLVSAVASEQRMTTGEVLNRILEAWRDSGGPLTAAPEAPETSFEGKGGADYRAELDAILGRLTALETALAERPMQVQEGVPVPRMVRATAKLVSAGARKPPKGGRSLSADEIAEVVRLRREGLSQGKIAVQFGVSQSYVSNVLRDHG